MLKDDEETVARVIRLAGTRPAVPAERENRVRRAVLADWQRANRRRAAWRMAGTAAALVAAAAVMVITARLWTDRRTMVAPEPAAAVAIVASVERVEQYAAFTPGDSIRAGAGIETPAAGRIALRLADRTSLRLDAGTRMRFVSATVIELVTGAVYVDTGAASTGVEVRTPLGVVRDIGTQYEVRVDPSALRVSVRTGRVELQGTADPVSVGPGTRLMVNDRGSVTSAVPTSGPEWSWIASLAPAFDIEGKPLASFLDHLAHEYGWTIRYADAQLARDASGIILHGSIRGLSPEESLAVAVRTSGLSFRFHDGEVVLSRAAERR